MEDLGKLLTFVAQRSVSPLKKNITTAIRQQEAGIINDPVDLFTEELTSRILAMSEHQLDTIVYNGRDPMSRRLADWWDTRKYVAERQAEQKAHLLTAKGAKEFFDKHRDSSALAHYAKVTGFYFDDEDTIHVFVLTDGVAVVSGMDGVAVWGGRKL